MAHAGQEFALEPIGVFDFLITGFQLLVGCEQLRRITLLDGTNAVLAFLALADIMHQGDHVQYAVSPIGTQPDFHRKQRAVFPLGL